MMQLTPSISLEPDVSSDVSDSEEMSLASVDLSRWKNPLMLSFPDFRMLNDFAEDVLLILS